VAEARDRRRHLARRILRPVRLSPTLLVLNKNDFRCQRWQPQLEGMGIRTISARIWHYFGPGCGTRRNLARQMLRPVRNSPADTLTPTPYTLHPAPYTPHYTLYTLHYTPPTLHPKPNPQPPNPEP